MTKLKDKKITIVSREKIEGDLGDYYEDVPLAENIWAHYRHASTKEKVAVADTKEYKMEAVFFINWRNDLDNTMKIEYNGDKYGITDIDDYEGYKNDLKITAYFKDNE